MKQIALAVMMALGVVASAQQVRAVTCVNGAYRAGCAGPHGAVAVHKAPYRAPYRTPYRGHSVTCANGVYRAGCVGPHGAAVVRKPY